MSRRARPRAGSTPARPPTSRGCWPVASRVRWPDFAALGVTAHPSFGTGPIYRGRFGRLSLVVLADQGVR